MCGKDSLTCLIARTIILLFLLKASFHLLGRTMVQTVVQEGTAFEVLMRKLQKGENKTDLLCSELLDGNLTIPWTEEQSQKMKHFKKYLQQVLREEGSGSEAEGHSAQFPEEYKLYFNIASSGFARTVCETGFNAGHSTFMWLAADPHLHVYSFDLGRHHYTRPMARYLQVLFPHRLNITFGDSTKTIPQFHKRNSDINCDLVVIDGGHNGDVPMKDFQNFHPMVNTSSDHLILLDDWPSNCTCFSDIGNMWKEVTRKGSALTITQCTNKKFRRGLTIGMYSD